MADSETFWLPVAQFEDNFGVIEQLESEGILIREKQGKCIGFRHQTLFDYTWARAFVKGVGNLTKFVLARQDALFIRPKLWSSLIYLRSVGSPIYKTTLGQLLNKDNLRLHLRFLLIEFLGQVEEPDEQEKVWLMDYLKKPQFRLKVLSAIEGKRGWYKIIKSYLPQFMIKTNKEAWAVCSIFINAWPFAKAENLQFIKKYWLSDKSKDNLILYILRHLRDWDEETVQILCRLIKRSTVDNSIVMLFASTVSKSKPHLAPMVVATALNKQFEIAENDYKKRKQISSEDVS